MLGAACLGNPGPANERLRPNELWHVDIKGSSFINLGGRSYIKT